MNLDRTQTKLLSDIINHNKSLKGLHLDFEFIKILLQLRPRLLSKLDEELLTEELFHFFLSFSGPGESEEDIILEVNYTTVDGRLSTKVTRNNLASISSYIRFSIITKKMYKHFPFLVSRAIREGNFHLINQYKLSKKEISYEMYLFAVSINSYDLKYVPREYYTRELIFKAYQAYTTQSIYFDSLFYKLDEILKSNLLSSDELDNIMRKSIRNLDFISEEFYTEEYIDLYNEYMISNLSFYKRENIIEFTYDKNENKIYYKKEKETESIIKRYKRNTFPSRYKHLYPKFEEIRDT